MPRYKITIEYDGAPFAGWQRQSSLPSVQGALEAAVRAFSGEAPVVHGAGRTDAGVHALGQVAHFDLEKVWDAYRVGEALNFHLKPQPVAVLECREVSPVFEARFSAIQRSYAYRLLARRAPATLDHGRVWRVVRPLDATAMHEAAQQFVGLHDFTTFRSTQCQSRSPLKTIDTFAVETRGAEILCRVSARSFLHNQVRSMVGALKLVGEGTWTADDVAKAIDARQRAACAPIAPPHGLYLERVDYPPNFA